MCCRRHLFGGRLGPLPGEDGASTAAGYPFEPPARGDVALPVERLKFFGSAVLSYWPRDDVGRLPEPDDSDAPSDDS